MADAGRMVCACSAAAWMRQAVRMICRSFMGGMVFFGVFLCKKCQFWAKILVMVKACVAGKKILGLC